MARANPVVYSPRLPKQKKGRSAARSSGKRSPFTKRGGKGARSGGRDAQDRDAPSGGQGRSGRGRGVRGEAQGVANCTLVVNPSGFAFAERVDGEGTIFVPPGNLGGAMDGDEVVVAHWPAQRGPEGHVRSVVTRKRSRVTGVLRRMGRDYLIEPDDPRILGNGAVLGAVDRGAEGLVVVGRMVDYPDAWNEDFSVQVERVLGEQGSLSTEVERVLVEHGIDTEFPDEVLEEAAQAPTRVRPSDHAGRADLRDLDFMTIDPPDARDFDDAVCVEVDGSDLKTADMRIHVAVADVSHYVREGTAIDACAAERCFSAYLPDRAIPMLPEELSSNICSLVPKKDRLAMVVSADVDANGKLDGVEVRAAIIHSRMRLTYDQVAKALDGEKSLHATVRRRLTHLRAVADRLRGNRSRRGAVELNLPESKVVLDEDDPTRIRDVVSARSDPSLMRAYNLIEELMLAANEATAQLGVRRKLPVVYRIHDAPDEERLERFGAVVELLGAGTVDTEALGTPKGMQKFLKQASQHPRAGTLNMLLLRTMAQAEYDVNNLGHFALASRAYLHFTSPIRRYPDLISHRVLKAFLARSGGMAGPEPVPRMPRPRESQGQAHTSSSRERVVVQAERDTKAVFAAAYMRDRIGDRFEGTVTGVGHSGFYVTIDDPFVDGMVRRTGLEKASHETYEMDEMGIRMVATKSNHAIALGDRVIVEVVDASPARRQIDLALVSVLVS